MLSPLDATTKDKVTCHHERNSETPGKLHATTQETAVGTAEVTAKATAGSSKDSHSNGTVRFQARPKHHIDAIVTMSIIQLFLLITFVPNSIVEIMTLFIHVHSYVQPFTRILVMLHPIFNPIIYVLRIPELRAEIVRICKK